MIRHRNNTQGFALLITMVVVGIVLAVGISLLNITLKQLTISISSRDSEVAFSAAQSASECSQFTLQQTDLFAGDPLPASVSCFDNSVSVSNSNFASNVTEYQFTHSWNNGNQDVCSESTIYVIDARSGAESVNFSNQGLNNITCADGDICSVIFARGFNRDCGDLASLRTVQRELTVLY